MTVHNAAGAQLNKTGVEALAPQDTVPVATRTFTQDVYASVATSGEAAYGSRRVLLFKAGQTVKQADIDALFQAGTATGITPATSAVAGGTKHTVTGTRLDGVTGVTIGGNAATNVVVVSSMKVTFTAPAHAAGAVAVSLADDAGAIAMAGNPVTYA
jgi:hypothetical protein